MGVAALLRVDRIACAGVENRGGKQKSTKRCGLDRLNLIYAKRAVARPQKRTDSIPVSPPQYKLKLCAPPITFEPFSSLALPSNKLKLPAHSNTEKLTNRPVVKRGKIHFTTGVRSKKGILSLLFPDHFAENLRHSFLFLNKKDAVL